MSEQVRLIALIGGESSGKSTLAAALAERFDTLWVHEYGRELWIEREATLDFEDLLAIGEVQVAREEEALRRARRFLFCDTTALVTAFYSHSLFGRIDPRLQRLAERRYDHHLLCAPDFAFVQDGHRVDEAYRQEQHDYYVAALREQGQAFTLIEGASERRIERAVGVLLSLD
jgi:NadR type nicotinamide-nucleotide adenylyltransferase